MEIETALKNQYHASLDMLKQAIKRCPKEVWTAGSSQRPFWRIAYHAIFYTDWYLEIKGPDFKRWELDESGMASLWSPVPSETVYTKKQLLAYWQICDDRVDWSIDAMDLGAEHSGFSHYPISKMDHQLVNLRHLQHHVGQLSERLLEVGIDLAWLGERKKKADSE